MNLFTLMSSDVTNIDFENIVKNTKELNIFKYRNFYNGGGVAIGDINNDGLADIFLTANLESNRLFLNKGGLAFEDISIKANVMGNKPWSTGAVMVDINADGLLDIYVCNAGNMKGDNHDNDLYINNGDLTFTESAAAFNLDKSGFTTHAAFFDYDKDGDLDAYILNNSNIPVSSLGYADQRDKRAQDWDDVPTMFRGVGDMLLRNDDSKFRDVSSEAGIYGSLIGFGLGVMISDINNDLYPDIYVSNDFYERDYLYINNQDGTFTEDIKNWTSHLCLSAMGVDMADINNDGLADIFITDMLPEEDERVKSVMEFEGYNVFDLKQKKDFSQQYIQNTLQLNNGNNSFTEIAFYSGIAKTDWSWAGLLFDMDNDGYKDIYITNGINHDLTDLDFVNFFANEVIQKMVLTGQKETIDSIINKMPKTPLANYAYQNQRDLTFKNKADSWGLGTPGYSNGAAYGDLDNDGDLDLIVNNVNMEVFVYRNNSESVTRNNFIRLRLEGINSNRFGLGAKVRLHIGDEILLQEQMPSRGFQASMDNILTIGLGKAEVIDSLIVLWPDDREQRLFDLAVNQTLALIQDNALSLAKRIDLMDNDIALIKELPNDVFLNHEENDYNDFDFEGMISKKLSQEGPPISIGDVDSDGNEDIFIGGGRGQAGMIYMHKGNGQVRRSTQKPFEEDKKFEDTAARLFDMDMDGDLDLIVGSGGNQVEEGVTYQTRFYTNNGSGKFEKSDFYVSSSNNNISTINTNDIDGDGDMDVFIGSRSIVGIYGIDPQHFLLLNEGNGQFKDVTDSHGHDLKNAGMVTGATWADVLGSHEKELIIISEWGTPMIYEVNSGRLLLVPSTLDSLHGMWGAIQVEDLDADGDRDIILGNQGRNTAYIASKESPMKIWINDFDDNGTIEQITTRTIDGRDYPIHMKKELTNQVVSLKKQNLKASDYASRTIQDLYPKEIVDNSIIKMSNITESIVAINEGNGEFSIKYLPNRVQFSCICGITCMDINGDGNKDLIMGGNNFDFKPQYSRLDGSYGDVVINDGNMNFTWKGYNDSGFFVKNEIRQISRFKDRDNLEFMIVAINDGKPRIFSVNTSRQVN